MATVEFALLSVLFFFVMIAGLDIGMWYQQRLRLDSAVEHGSMVAFNSRSSVDQGGRLAQQAGATMHEVVAGVSELAAEVGEIASASAEQSSGLGQVNRAVLQMDASTQQNAALVEQDLDA